MSVELDLSCEKCHGDIKGTLVVDVYEQATIDITPCINCMQTQYNKGREDEANELASK